MHLTQKIAITAGALTLAVTGIAAAAGSPPDAADEGLTTAGDQVGVELPAAKDAHPGAAVEDQATEADTEDADAPEGDVAEAGQGPVDNHGAEVVAVAHGDTTGRAHGEAVSAVASQGHSEANAAPQADLGADNAGEHGRP